MNKTKEDLLSQINNLENKNEFLDKMRSGEEYNLFQIKMNCVKNKCPNLDVLKIDNDAYFICNTEWSGFDLGWEIIYSEILDLCFEIKTRNSLEDKLSN